jgi:hypothetical protein
MLRIIDTISICLLAASLFLILAPYADLPSGGDDTGGVLWNNLRPLFWLGVALGIAGILTPLLIRLCAKRWTGSSPRSRHGGFPTGDRGYD